MEISQFARAVLCSPLLSDKLVEPDRFTDRRASDVGRIPDRPARLAEMAFSPRERRTPFPKAASLEREPSRAVALHYFANHELLALELMALALLRFPDADPSFRHGIARIMLDEQKHFALYRERVEALGVGFGEHGLNSFFWDTLSGLSTPVEYVTQLAMTFEQANLDYAAFYRDLFDELGDGASRDVLHTVHEDEVQHLAFGLHWFERWRDPSQDLWEAWTGELPAPLGPSWGRGIDAVGFSVDGRRRAGLPDPFIRRVRTCSHSKGRPSSVLLFNPARSDLPGGERGDADQLRRDLAPTFGLLAGREDLLLASPEGLEVLERLQAVGVQAPEMLDAEEAEAVLATRRHLFAVRPWRWDEAARSLSRRLEDRRVGPPPPDAGLLTRLESEQFAAALVEDLGAAAPADGAPELTLSFHLHGGGPERAPDVTRAAKEPLGHGFVVGNPFVELPADLRRWLHEPTDPLPEPGRAMRRATERARAWLAEAGYDGPATLDFEVHQGPAGRSWRLARVAARPTMGQVAARLARLIPSGRLGLWLHVDRGAASAAGFADFEALDRHLRAVLPVQIVRRGDHPRLQAGALPTSDPRRCQRRFTVLLVGRSAAELREHLASPA